MKKLKKVLWVLASLILLVIIGLIVFIQTLKPDYSGEKKLPGLQKEVNVHFDTYGIPHIYAENEPDALRALGYVHAQDRLWQMELLRRLAKGELSEVFGPDLVDTDKFFLSLGIDEHSKATIANLDPKDEMVVLCESYLEGVNSFIENGPTPVEFYLTGIEKRPFVLEDIYNVVGYMAFSFAQAHKTDPLLTSIRQEFGEEYINDLAVYSDTTTVWIKNYKDKVPDSLGAEITAYATKALKELPVPLFEGSNSWVLSPSKTKNGKVILANDPHIGFAQPSVWYEAHVNAPGYEKYGYHLGGVPFPLLGHNQEVAYGLTMLQNDDLDFYFEQINPQDSTQYKTENGWETFEYVTKTIRVKDGADVEYTYKKTRNGMIMNGVAKQVTQEQPVAMSWMYVKLKNEVMQGLFELSHAGDIDEFQEALPKIHAPGLNVMYGDAEGNVAWWATAKLYTMPDSISTKFILDGASGDQVPQRFLDFSENPSAVNPPWDYVYSANNQPDSTAGMLYPGYYLPENRAKRIVQLLDAKNDWDLESTSEMILDVTSSVNPSLVTELIKLVDVSQLSEQQLVWVDALKNWDGHYGLDEISPTLFHRSEYYMLKNTFEDELGEERFNQFLGTHLLKRHIAWGAQMEDGVWWDNVHTQDIEETRLEVLLKSFDDAWLSLVEDFGPDPNQWKWGKVHTLEHQHPIGRVESLRDFFNVGPFPVEGTREVINNLAFPYDDTGLYKVSSGPSTRRVIDFSDIENSVSILPTGQSGNPFSKHYEDQAEMYVQGKFRRMLINKKEIEENTASLLMFKK